MRSQIPSSIRRILRSVESQSAFLRCRGLDVPRPHLPDAYARFLVERTFGRCGPMPTASGSDRAARRVNGNGRSPEVRGGSRWNGTRESRDPRNRGYDVRDPGGVGYRVVGRKLERRNREVGVPGVPGRGFDRLVLVRFDSAYHVLFAGMTAAVDFLHASEYREERNEWLLPLWDPFWSGEAVWDLTDVFRTAAAQVAMEDAPFLEPWTPVRTPRPGSPAGDADTTRRRRRRDGGDRGRQTASGPIPGGGDPSG